MQQATDALDVEQGFLQQDQLRLQGQLVTACHLEQLDHHFGQRDLAQGSCEIRFAHRTDCGLELVHARAPGHPAGLHVQFGNALVVLAEQGEKIFREPILIALGQGAHDAEVQRNETRVVHLRRIHPDVAGVRIGMKEVVTENLGVEQLHALLGQAHAIDTGSVERGKIVHRDAVHARQGEYLGGRMRPDHFRNHEVVGIAEIAPQQAGVGALALQVELVAQGQFQFRHYVQRTDLVGIRMHAIDQLADAAQQGNVALDAHADIRTQHLDHHGAAIGEARRMHLRDRCRCQWCFIESGKALADRLAERVFDRFARLRSGKRSNLVLKCGECVGDVSGQEIPPCRQQLAELDEDWTQLGECKHQPFAAWKRVDLRTRARHHPACPAQQAKSMRVIDHFIQAVAHQYDGDAQQ